jgi:hypothetical protein
MEDTDVYQQLKDAGCALYNHESDLYVEATPTALGIVKASGRSFTRFTSQVDGKQWLDVPFAYRPWWDKRTGKQEPPAPMTAPDTQPPAWALRVAQEIEDTCALPESYAHEIAAIIARESPVGELAGALREVLEDLRTGYISQDSVRAERNRDKHEKALRAALAKLA